MDNDIDILPISCDNKHPWSNDNNKLRAAERILLFDAAKNGDKRARKILREHYNVTALWNGKEMEQLDGAGKCNR